LVWKVRPSCISYFHVQTFSADVSLFRMTLMGVVHHERCRSLER
jgi:hypothetical protein